MGSVTDASERNRRWTCKACKQKDSVQTITLPFVFRYLVAELSAMNIKVKLDVAPISSQWCVCVNGMWSVDDNSLFK